MTHSSMEYFTAIIADNVFVRRKYCMYVLNLTI